jgi:autotransporter-associated beta strand protein
MNKFCTAALCGVIAPSVCLVAPAAFAVNDVNLGTLFTLSNTATAPNGAWSWYEDERAIIDTGFAGGPLLLVSSVSSGANGSPESGDIDLMYRNLATGAQGEFEFHNRLERDDHNSAALFIMPDGRYLASYSRHGSDQLTRWRISTHPHDPTAWGPEQSTSNGAGTTYNNTYFLPDDNGGSGQLYNFTRHTNFDPNVQTWDAVNQAWDNRGKLLTQGGGGDRPYVRYASDGEKIHFIATEEHPRDFLNSIYHGYVQDGQLFDTDGNVVDANIFDGAGVSPTALTRVFANGSASHGVTMNRAWTISMEVDNTGRPVAIFSARANDDDEDHRFFYARHNGADWVVNEMAHAGGFLYHPENDYTGLASIDPDNPNVVYMSSEIDPITGSATASGKYELYKGVTGDFGQNWDWTAITQNSTMDNLRPVVPQWDGENTAVTWMRGTYDSYTSWDTQVVGINFATIDAKSQLWTGAASNLWDTAGEANWNSGGGTAAPYSAGDEVAFDDTATAYVVNITASVAPTGVAFNNNANDYTLVGSGITGGGTLRVIGGGTVTLNNGANTYTGDTLIARGTLKLQNNAAIAGSPHIDVRAGGRFDVTAAAGGAYTLAGQTLTIDGEVDGSIRATAGSTVHVNSNKLLNGDLVADGSLVEGLGTVNGDLTAQAAAVIRVGGEGFTPQFSNSGIVYVDADFATNTTLANGNAAGSGVHYSTLNAADNRWNIRAFANGGDIISSNDAGAEDAPALRTAISGLTPGEEIEVYAYAWGAINNGNWRLRASLVGPDADGTADGQVDDAWNARHFSGSSFAAMTALSFDLQGDNPGPITTDNPAGFEDGGHFDNLVLTREADRGMAQAFLGTATADANGEVFVYIDDLAFTSQSNRSWYDGVGFRSIGTASQAIAQVNTLTVTGDVSLANDATLEMDIFAGDVLDRLVVHGGFNAGGTLKVNLVAGADSPKLGDRFDLIDFGDVTGSFNAYDLPTLDAGLYWDTNALLTIGVITVTDVAPLPGDTDGDGDVDDADLGTSFANYTGPLGQGAGNKTAAQGDNDGDGDVDDADLGVSFSAYTGPLAGANVPEPTTFALIGLGGLLVARRRRSA